MGRKVKLVRTPPGTVLVRCLGLRPGEHWFYSTDRKGHRRCADCEKALREMGLGQRAYHPARDHSGERE
jgi:hypothetical protein